MAAGKMRSLIAGVALAIALVSPAIARSTVNVEADSVEYFEAEGKTIFRGNVVATRDSDTIIADEMVVLSGDKDETGAATTKSVEAKGNVRVTTAAAKITGDMCRFDVVQNNINVTGNVSLTQGTSTMRGQKLLIDLKSNRIKMQGGRVSGSFVPN